MVKPTLRFARTKETVSPIFHVTNQCSARENIASRSNFHHFAHPMASGHPVTGPATVDLRSLIGHCAAVPATLLVETVLTEFTRTNADFLAVLEGDNLLGVCARRELVQALGTRFGFSLNARQPVRLHLMTAPMQVTRGTAVTEVFKTAAARADREFYDDVLLVDECGQYLGMIPMGTLVRLQTQFLLDNIVSLEASRQEIAAKNNEMEKDLLMAREVQLAMLPHVHAPLAAGGLTLQIAHRFHPASGVSGDFFDVLHLPGNLAGILVCDVMGHGVRSALIAAMVRAMLEELKSVAADPGLFLTRLNHDLTSILRHTGSLIFVTAAYAVIDPGRGQLRYAQAGHPTPLHHHAWNGTVRPVQCSLESAGPALGLIDDFVFGTTTEMLTAGDWVVLFTDGLTEAPAPDGEEYGTNRLVDFLTRECNLPLNQALDTLLGQVTAFCSGLAFPDDVCVVAAKLEMRPAPLAPDGPGDPHVQISG
jgi:serine phosphatase RsbU (regulator of sigma subunit)